MKELAARRATECAALCHTHSRLSCRFASSLTASSAGIKAKPYKLGRLNRETEYVLQALGLEAPDDLFALEPGTPVAIVDTNNPDELPDGISKVKLRGPPRGLLSPRHLCLRPLHFIVLVPSAAAYARAGIGRCRPRAACD